MNKCQIVGDCRARFWRLSVVGVGVGVGGCGKKAPGGEKQLASQWRRSYWKGGTVGNRAGQAGPLEGDRRFLNKKM